MRLDGVLLACNDAALSLFGVATLGGILKTDLTHRLVAADRAKWQEFTTRVYLVRDDGARPVAVQGIALKDHPDGVDSLLLSLRDQSQTHRLEHSIQSAEVTRVGQEERQRAARDQVEETIAEHRRLAALADEHQAECRRLTEALAAQTADCERREAKFVELEKRVEESQLASLGKEREHRARVAALETALAVAHAAHATRPSVHDKNLAQTGQQQPVSGEPDRRELLDFERRLKASTAEQSRLRAIIGDHEIQRERIAAEHQAAVATLEQSLALANQEAALSRDRTRQTLAELRSQLAQALVEQSRLATREEEHEGERDHMIAEHQRALGDLEASKREALVDLRSQLSQALTEQRQVAARAEEEHERERHRMSAESDLARADLETSKREALATLHSQLSQALAEQGRLTAQADEDHELERHRMSAEHQRGIADLENSKRDALAYLHSQLSQTAAEERRLAARAEELERERDRMSIDHERAIADLETRRRDALAELRSQLWQTSSAEKSRLADHIEELERERDRMSAEHRRAIADLQTSKAEALAEAEGLLTEIHQALFKDGLAGVERRLIDTIDETERETADLERLAELQGGLTQAISEMQTVLAPDDALQEPFEADDASLRERAERTQDEAIVGIKPPASSREDS
ncbi:MAG: hypothetical protein DMF92_17720 [Acidobacteria bacterium]|nr:MAG: hypothetical protein DMF92_17720 [Acidobacteriota bacterium]